MSNDSSDSMRNGVFLSNSVKSLNSDLRRRIELAKKLGIKFENSELLNRLNIDADFPDEYRGSSNEDNSSKDAGFSHDMSNSYHSIEDNSYNADDSGEINISDEDVGIYKRGRERGKDGKIIAFLLIAGFIFLMIFAK